METETNLKKNLKVIRTLYPEGGGLLERIEAEILKGLPFWMKSALTIYATTLGDGAGEKAPTRLFLVYPNDSLTFDQVTLIQKMLSAAIGPNFLLVADLLPAKYRPLLVRSRIPFVYKDKAIFAPQLGVKFDQLKDVEAKPKPELHLIDEKLSPASMKFVAGLLTKHIPERFTLKALHESVVQAGTKMSIAKLSQCLNDLAQKGFLIAKGAGPYKSYVMNSRLVVWDKMQSIEKAPFFRSLEASFLPKRRSDYVVSGETALSHYSNLAAPTTPSVAMTAKQFREISKGRGSEAALNGDRENSCHVQVWREDPALFAVDGAINPIELYFSLRTHPDERIQMSLDEMLRKFGLERGEK